MGKERVTIQDIADSLGLSRNTVSKALNGAPNLPERTRSAILQRAAEMNYKQYALITKQSPQAGTGTIALMTGNMPGRSHFGSLLLAGLEKRISECGYTLSMHILRKSDIDKCILPINFDCKNIDGIICIELFDVAYSRLICSLGKPTVFADTFSDYAREELDADLLLMENRFSTYSMLKKLIDFGVRRFGFVGDRNHCLSFRERWEGFNQALNEYNLPVNMDECILDSDSAPYQNQDWMAQKLSAIPKLPDAILCANDYQAINVMNGLKKLKINVPNDILICGFDDAPEAKVVEPNLTTVKIPSSDMGVMAAEMLFDRIKEPALPYRNIHVRTTVKFRESTGYLGK